MRPRRFVADYELMRRLDSACGRDANRSATCPLRRVFRNYSERHTGIKRQGNLRHALNGQIGSPAQNPSYIRGRGPELPGKVGPAHVLRVHQPAHFLREFELQSLGPILRVPLAFPAHLLKPLATLNHGRIPSAIHRPRHDFTLSISSRYRDFPAGFLRAWVQTTARRPSKKQNTRLFEMCSLIS